MEMITQASAMPTIFEPSLLVLMSAYLFEAVVFLILSGAVYALLHRLLANRKSTFSAEAQADDRSVGNWSRPLQPLYREVE